MKSKKKTLVEALIYVLLIIVCVWLVPKYVVQRTVVSGESMQDTLQNGESLLVILQIQKGMILSCFIQKEEM